jgi:hypothetical protein
VLMAIRLVRKEVPQMSDRSGDDPSFGRAFTPAVFSRPGEYVGTVALMMAGWGQEH